MRDGRLGHVSELLQLTYRMLTDAERTENLETGVVRQSIKDLCGVVDNISSCIAFSIALISDIDAPSPLLVLAISYFDCCDCSCALLFLPHFGYIHCSDRVSPNPRRIEDKERITARFSNSGLFDMRSYVHGVCTMILGITHPSSCRVNCSSTLLKYLLEHLRDKPRCIGQAASLFRLVRTTLFPSYRDLSF